MENADETGMRRHVHPDCWFVHIGTSCGLDKEIKYYTDKIFLPTNVEIHDQKAVIHGDTGIVYTDVDYGLLLDGKETTHHFMVTEVYQKDGEEWKLISFSFTALVY